MAADRLIYEVLKPKWIEKEIVDAEKFEQEVADRVASWTLKQKKKRQEVRYFLYSIDWLFTV